MEKNIKKKKSTADLKIASKFKRLDLMLSALTIIKFLKFKV